jgi:hypothetical protein
MRLPTIQGVIRRRILVNFRVDPEVMQSQIPSRFRPKLHEGHAIAGICLIRLEEIRPRFVPAALGVASENAAHRVAVRWTDDAGADREGVFIPRRDTGSTLNQIAGGRLFPGVYYPADFDARMSGGRIDLDMESSDGEVRVRVHGEATDRLPPGSCFADISEASRFFEGGALGYSATSEPGRLDGMTLRTKSWKVEPLRLDDVYSSYFSDEIRFPPGSVHFDCALLMRNVEHEWHEAEDLFVD